MASERTHELQCKIDTLKLSKIKHHIFLCCDQTKPKCCQENIGLRSWTYLKKRLAELNLMGEGGIYCTRANCLRVCYQGPIAIVYLDGIWYRSCTPEIIERIIQDHFIGGKPVEEYILIKNDPCKK